MLSHQFKTDDDDFVNRIITTIKKLNFSHFLIITYIKLKKKKQAQNYLVCFRFLITFVNQILNLCVNFCLEEFRQNCFSKSNLSFD